MSDQLIHEVQDFSSRHNISEEEASTMLAKKLKKDNEDCTFSGVISILDEYDGNCRNNKTKNILLDSLTEEFGGV